MGAMPEIVLLIALEYQYTQLLLDEILKCLNFSKFLLLLVFFLS